MTQPAGASVLVVGADKSFGRVTALHSVSLKVQPGEAVAIAGRSAASTLPGESSA